MRSERRPQALASAGADQLSAIFLDIGQGDATVLVLPGGREAVLVDCGAGGALTMAGCLEATTVTTVPIVFLTHSDNDHVGGIIEVLRNFPGTVREIAFNPERLPKDMEEQKYRLLLRQLADYSERTGCRLARPRAGDEYKLDAVVIAVLHPSEQNWFRTLADDRLRNDGSVVLRVDYGATRLLLTADVQAQGWRWMLDRQEDVKADILKYPHHGAWYAETPTPDKVLKLVDPQLAVISVGSRNPHAHPRQESLNALRAHVAARSASRFVCTQVTTRRDPNIRAAVGCAGTVVVAITGSEFTVSPSYAAHDEVVQQWMYPQCRAVEPESRLVQRPDVVHR